MRKQGEHRAVGTTGSKTLVTIHFGIGLQYIRIAPELEMGTGECFLPAICQFLNQNLCFLESPAVSQL